MPSRFLLASLTLLFLVSGTGAQESKTFSDDNCSYTLPDDDWEWLDPAKAPKTAGKNVAFAKSAQGLVFLLRVVPMQALEKRFANSYESFEAGYLKSSGAKKSDGKAIIMKGLPAYQFEATAPQGFGTILRQVYANRRLYVLEAMNALGPLSTSKGESIMQGFDFVGTPEPVLAESAFELGRAMGQGAVALAVIVVVVVGVVLLVRKRSKPA